MSDVIFYVVRDLVGRILKTGRCRRVDLLGQAQGDEVSEETDHYYDDAKYFWQDGEYVLRPSFDIEIPTEPIPADGETAAVITGIPSGAHVSCGGIVKVADGEPFEFTSDSPGRHIIEVELFPYLSEKVIIDAV